MRRALLLLVALASALAVARADDDEPSLPLNPFTEAKEGDWETLLFRVEVPGRETITQLSTWRVKKVTDDQVSVDVETIVPEGTGKPDVRPRTFARKGKITVREYFSIQPDEKVEGFKKKERTFTLDGHRFDGQEIELSRSGGKVSGSCILMLSPEVKGSGVVLLECEVAGGMRQQWSVVGFGTAQKKLWGKAADEVPITEGAGERVGFNLYRDKVHAFSIHAPRFMEVQDRMSADTFIAQGAMTTFVLTVQGGSWDRKRYREAIRPQLEAAGYKIVKEEERKVSGKEALLLEYTAEMESPKGKVDGRVVDLAIFREAHVLFVRARAPQKVFDGPFGKSLQSALANVKLIDIGVDTEHKGEEPGVFHDHRYGIRLPIPELPRLKAGVPQCVVEFQGPVVAHGNTSRVVVNVLKAGSRADYKPSPAAGFEVVAKKDIEVAGCPAVEIELKGSVKGQALHEIKRLVFDKTRTFEIDAWGTEIAWTENEAAFRDSVASFAIEKKP